jgi:GMP synthase-like glutamine amidotransferase
MISPMTPALEILVLEHERECPAALFEDWAVGRGHSLRTLVVPALERWPDPGEVDVVVSLGSDRSVHASPERWIAREIEFLRDAHDSGVPVLGICFGAQALSKALGGDVARTSRLEPKWTTLDVHDHELIPPGPWFRGHEDMFSVPPAAREIARAGEIPLAFVQGASVGVQFHPEAGAALINTWIDGSRGRLAELAIDEHDLRREAELTPPDTPKRAYDLFDRIARLWRRGSTA